MLSAAIVGETTFSLPSRAPSYPEDRPFPGSPGADHREDFLLARGARDEVAEDLLQGLDGGSIVRPDLRQEREPTQGRLRVGGVVEG